MRRVAGVVARQGGVNHASGTSSHPRCSHEATVQSPAPLLSLSMSASSSLDVSAARDQIAKAWDADVLQTLKDYISIPNQVK